MANVNSAAPRQRQRGPMGRMGGRSTEKAKDFKGTMLQLLGYIGQHKVAVFFGIAFAVCSVIFNIVGPEGSRPGHDEALRGTRRQGERHRLGRLRLDRQDAFVPARPVPRELRVQPHPGLAHDGRHAEDLLPHAQGDCREDLGRPHELLQRSQQGRRALPHHERRRHARARASTSPSTQLITSITQIVGVLVMMLSISLPLTGVTVLTLPAAALIMIVMINFSQPYFREQQQVLGAVNGIIEEDFAGQNVIAGLRPRRRRRAAVRRERTTACSSPAGSSQFLSGLMMPLMSLVGNMGYVGVVVVGAQLALTGNATPGDIQSFIQYVRNFTQPVQPARQREQHAAVHGRGHRARLRVPRRPGGAARSTTAQVPENARWPRRVRARALWLRRRTRRSSMTSPAWPSLARPWPSWVPRAPARRRSSSCSMRFYDVDAGSHQGRRRRRPRFRPRTSCAASSRMVLQDTWLFNGTIRENIRYGQCPTPRTPRSRRRARAARSPTTSSHTLAERL